MLDSDFKKACSVSRIKYQQNKFCQYYFLLLIDTEISSHRKPLKVWEKKHLTARSNSLIVFLSAARQCAEITRPAAT